MIRVAKTLGLILLIFIISISSNIVAIELEESFKFCDEENKSTKQEIVCNQDELGLSRSIVVVDFFCRCS